MIYVYVILIILNLWLWSSVMWLTRNVGNKYMEDRWYDKILATPVVIIAYIVGWCSSKGKQK